MYDVWLERHKSSIKLLSIFKNKTYSNRKEFYIIKKEVIK